MKIILLLCYFSFSLAIDGNGAEEAMDNSKKSIEVLLDANVGLIAKRLRKCVIMAIDSSRTGNMTKDAMGDRIANFCQGYSLLFKNNKKNLKREALDNSKKSIEVLLDANVGLIAKRIRKCVILPIDSSRTGNMTKDAMGDRIANFCQGYSLLFKNNKKNLKREALELLRDRSKRDLTVREFVICNYANINVIQYCPRSRLAVLCKFHPGAGCQDVVLCNKFSSTGSNCKGVHTGCRLNCCDFVCLSC